MEVALMVIIVGVAITASMEFLVAATRANQRLGVDGRAMAIARSAHEWAQRQTVANITEKFASPLASDARYKVFTPSAPALLDADGLQLNDSDEQRTFAYSQWSEELRMRRVSESDPTAFDSNSRLIEITVIVRHNGQEAAQLRRVFLPAS